MIILGLTGGIATGKGVVAKTWAQQPGVVVHDADDVVHQLYQPGSQMVAELTEAFGDEILDANGGVNRKALGGIVFNDEAARQKLNGIVHPAVRDKYLELATEAQQQSTKVFVIEAALLLDSNPDHSFFHAFIITEVEQTEQVRRLIKRDGLSEGEALKRIESQLSQAKRRERADYVIDTSGAVEETRKRALALLDTLKQKFA